MGKRTVATFVHRPERGGDDRGGVLARSGTGCDDREVLAAIRAEEPRGLSWRAPHADSHEGLAPSIGGRIGGCLDQRSSVPPCEVQFRRSSAAATSSIIADARRSLPASVRWQKSM